MIDVTKRQARSKRRCSYWLTLNVNLSLEKRIWKSMNEIYIYVLTLMNTSVNRFVFCLFLVEGKHNKNITVSRYVVF